MTPASFDAGKGWDYSDTNYIVLVMIRESYEKVNRRLLKTSELTDPIPQDGSSLKVRSKLCRCEQGEALQAFKELMHRNTSRELGRVQANQEAS